MTTRHVGAPAAGRQYVAEHLRAVKVEGQLVLLDMRAGEYAMLDSIATAMWAELRDNKCSDTGSGMGPQILHADTVETVAELPDRS